MKTRTVNLTFLALVTIAILLSEGCKKNQLNKTAEYSLVEEAQSFYLTMPAQQVKAVEAVGKLTPYKANLRDIKWQDARLTKISNGEAVLAPVHYAHPLYTYNSLSPHAVFDFNNMQWLIMYKDSVLQWHRELVTYYPDSNFINGFAFTGIATVEDWQGTLLNAYRYQKGSKISVLSVTHHADLMFIQTCYSSSGYNYSADHENEGYYWSVDLGCSYMYLPDVVQSLMPNGFDYGGADAPVSGGGGPTSLTSVQLISGKNIIANIHDYNKCFENIAGSNRQYTVTVCVDQPTPGSRSPWGFDGQSSSAMSSPFDVGHTFLILAETSPNGTVTRNVGFYPSDMVYPSSPISEAQLANDDEHNYDVSLSITMTNSQFFILLNYINKAADMGLMYNLNSNNCTNFAINALSAAGIRIPSTKGTWPGGGGNNPGDLGEDIRNMTLSSNMSRSSNSGSHPNTGSCY